MMSSWVDEFDSLMRERTSIASAGDRADEAQRKLKDAQHKARNAKNALADNERTRDDEAENVRLRNESWFWGSDLLQPQWWLHGGVEAAKKDSEAKIAECDTNVVRLAEAHTRRAAAVAPLKTQYDELKVVARRLAAVVARLKSIEKNQVAANPSDELIALQQDATRRAAAHTRARTDATAAANLSSLADEVLKLYESAERKLVRAEAFNEQIHDDRIRARAASSLRAVPAVQQEAPPPRRAAPYELVFGATVKLEHVLTGRRLHSHSLVYPHGSGQQQARSHHCRADSAATSAAAPPSVRPSMIHSYSRGCRMNATCHMYLPCR